MPLHIPLFLRNDRTIGLRDHIVDYFGFRVVLETQSPLVVLSALPLVHGKVGPLQVLRFGVKIAIAGLKPSGAANLGGLLLVVRVIRVRQVLGLGRVGRQAARLAVPVPEGMLFGVVVSLEGALAAAQEYEEQYGRHAQQGYSPYSTPDDNTCTVLLLLDPMVIWWVGREVWVGKDRWKGVSQCSGGRKCICAGAIFFFFFRKDDVRETRTEKQRGKEGGPTPTQQTPTAHKSPSDIVQGSDTNTHAASDMDRVRKTANTTIVKKKKKGVNDSSSACTKDTFVLLVKVEGAVRQKNSRRAFLNSKHLCLPFKVSISSKFSIKQNARNVINSEKSNAENEGLGQENMELIHKARREASTTTPLKEAELHDITNI